MNNSYSPPRHVAIIMDGNGRWAEKRGLPRLDGHRAGVRNVRPIVAELGRQGVSYITLYTFSTENWRRPQDEVNGLMELLKDVIRKETRNFHKDNVHILHFGTTDGISSDLKKGIQRAEKLTAKNTGPTLGLAFNYGGRAEILRAVKAIVEENVAAEDIDEATIERHLFTAGIPDVDLVIRTSGEYRTSNFLIWQAAYAEYYFTPVLWPDFNEQETVKALEDYSHRQRRYGGLEQDIKC